MLFRQKEFNVSYKCRHRKGRRNQPPGKDASASNKPDGAHRSQQKVRYAVNMAAKHGFGAQLLGRQTVKEVGYQRDKDQPEAQCPCALNGRKADGKCQNTP